VKRKELYNLRKKWFIENWDYELTHWHEFDYSILKKIMYVKRSGRGSNKSVNDCIIMADTETSKKTNEKIYYNHVVAWTISLQAYDQNIFTLFGHKPTSFCECLCKIIENLSGEDTIVYFHNLAYDWVFLRKFIIQLFGTPDRQLNTKSHYPILIEFNNGLILKDSLILAQRSLDKWAKDLNVEHQKALGKWDYDKLRNQDEDFTSDELEYIEHDTLAGVECINALMKILNKSIYSMPYTATGIPREESRNKGKVFHAHDAFNRMSLNYEQQRKFECIYHGGYTHGNRHFINTLINDNVKCYDFASSYPFVMLSEKYPMEKFTKYDNCSIADILENSDKYAFCFKLILIKPRLKSDFESMPALQFSKCLKTINCILDNGRILAADYIEIYITELDLSIIENQYVYDRHLCVDVEYSYKEYLPRWFTDYIFSLFNDKTLLKGGDPVAYALAKAKLNSLYGMCVQKPIKDNIKEDYLTGEYNFEFADPEELYEKYLKSYNTILPYQWGVYVTAYAFRNLFELGRCCETWIYSDTDSCYGINWNQELIEQYNDKCKQKLINNGYGCINFNNHEYWLGIAEFDGEYSQFKVMGAKRYCGRAVDDNELHITVAGVPKCGSICLSDNIDNFAPGFIFPGTQTGKKTHTYFYIDDIYIDENGNETGDSIDLSPCNYLLDDVKVIDWMKLLNEDIEVQVYEE